MTITWTKCSERMPPDEDKNIIVRYTGQSLSKNKTIISAGHEVHNLFNNSVCAVKEKYEWTPYTHEFWKELNR